MLSGLLWKWLIIPLGVLTALFLVMAFRAPNLNGLFVNLATTFLGILLTVCYVNYIIRRHDKQRWAITTVRIEARIQSFAIVTSRHFRMLFNIDMGVIHEEAMDYKNPSSIRSEMTRVIRDELLPRVDGAVPGVDQKGWATLSGQIEKIEQWGDQLIAGFGDRINPELFALILIIQDHVDDIHTMILVGFNILGVPDSVLIEKRPKFPLAKKRQMEREIAQNVKQILECCVLILEGLNLASAL